MAVVAEAGLYESEEAFSADAARTFLAARPDLRETIGCKLYEKGVFSLGRAAEMCWTPCWPEGTPIA
jgi:predicted HTH domain antitoxin